MTTEIQTLDQGSDIEGEFALPEAVAGDGDNITDWCLNIFQERYGDHITKDDIWGYFYGVMHAPDWREKYEAELRRNSPRIPLAKDFEAFSNAGYELMELHTRYSEVEEHPSVQCEVQPKNKREKMDEQGWIIDNGKAWKNTNLESNTNPYRIPEKSSMKLIDDNDKRSGKYLPDATTSTLYINKFCRLVNIPAEAQKYTVSGRSPIKWAIDSLKIKEDSSSGIVDDINLAEQWIDDPFELVRHLRRLVTVGVESHRIISNLPDSLDGEPVFPFDNMLPVIS